MPYYIGHERDDAAYLTASTLVFSDEWQINKKRLNSVTFKNGEREWLFKRGVDVFVDYKILIKFPKLLKPMVGFN